MKILVTGGAGYIGSHTCKALNEAGHSPITVDNLVSGHEWAVQWGPLHRVHIQDTDRLISLMIESDIQAVIHFAAYTSVGESVSDPLKYYENNVAGTVSLLRAMAAAKVRKIVFSSSCATYGFPVKTPITEEFPQNPISPYGQTKLIVERLLNDVTTTQSLDSVSLRYFNAAGADANLEIGEDHEPETHLVPLTIQAALNRDCELTVFGTDYPTVDGTCVRDYIHVTDLAAAHVKALESLKEESSRWRAFNLGTGRGHSVEEVIHGVNNVTGRSVKLRCGDRRKGDPPFLVASADLAMKELKWQPQHSSLKNILETSVRWYEKHHLKRKKE